MTKSPNLMSVTPLAEYPPNLEDDYEFDGDLLAYAKGYIGGFTWALSITETYIGYVLKEKFCVFLFKIEKVRDDVDDWIWVIVGDVPPAYITIDECRTPSEAVDGYIGAMEEWVKAASKGKDVEKLIPVNVYPNADNAEMLRNRLAFIDKAILPKIEDLEKKAMDFILH